MMNRIRTAYGCVFHFCQRLRGKIEPDHVVIVVALFLTGHSDSPTLTACAYLIIMATHTTHLMRAESRKNNDRELRSVEKREADLARREAALEREVRADERAEHIA